MNTFYTGKRILVTGGTGMIGRPLVRDLLAQGAIVTVVSLDDPQRAPAGCTFVKVDLREFRNCLEACAGKEIVFNLAGVKGSPAMTAKKPASFFVPTLMFNTNMMEAARQSNVSWYLYTSSVGVYGPREVFREEETWSTPPSENDRFAGWAKRMGELQAEAYKIEYEWNRVSIVRPANVYGPFDNFDPRNAMVIPSLIARAVGGENPLSVWGDGSPIRDVIYADDVARAMQAVVGKGVTEPINVGSGQGYSIREIAEMVAKHTIGNPASIQWDPTKPRGDAKRLMSMERAKRLIDFSTTVSLDEGIRRTVEWYKANRATADQRYNVFTR